MLVLLNNRTVGPFLLDIYSGLRPISGGHEVRRSVMFFNKDYPLGYRKVGMAIDKLSMYMKK